MNNSEQVKRLKITLGIDENDMSKDELLDLIIDDTVEYLQCMSNLPKENISPALVRMIATSRFNKLGTEGMDSVSYSGINQQFIDGLSKELKDQLYAIRSVKFC